MKWTREHSIYAMICASITAFWLLLYYFSQTTRSEDFYSPLLKAEFYCEDLRIRYGRKAEVDERIVFIGIDKQSYLDTFWPEELEESKALRIISEKQFPWSREIWALAAEQLIQSGAALVMIDLLFPNLGVGDEELRRVIRTYPDKIILGANFEKRELWNDGGTGLGYSVFWPHESIIGSETLEKSQAGIVNFWLDSDRTIRKAYFNIEMPIINDSFPTLTGLAARKLRLDSEYVGSFSGHRFRYVGPPQSVFKFYPIYEIFTPVMWDQNYNSGRFFKDKIIMIGPAGNWSQDLHVTPFEQNQMFGPEVHLNALNALLTDEFIQDSSYAIDLFMIFMAGVNALLIVLLFQLAWIRVAFIFVSAFIFFGFNWFLYDHKDLMLLMATPLLCLGTSGAGCMIRSFVRESLERARTRATLEKYVSQNVVKEILDNSQDFENAMGGSRRPCTILFSDIRGFTTMTEIADSHKLVVQLNEYLTEMVESVFKNNGTLDKFIGDAVMAVWGNAASRGPKEDAIDAVNSALDMLDALAKLNRTWRDEEKLELAIGIGVNHGEVIVGNMGSPKRKEFTVIGDAVNLASRLEGTTKQYGLPVVIGQNVANLVKDHFTLQKVDLIQVKGKKEPVQTYTVLSNNSQSLSNDELAGLEDYHAGIDAFLSQEFEHAQALFEKADEVFDRNQLAKLYINRCQDFRKTPPSPDWNGVVVMNTK